MGTQGRKEHGSFHSPCFAKEETEILGGGVAEDLRAGKCQH